MMLSNGFKLELGAAAPIQVESPVTVPRALRLWFGNGCFAKQSGLFPRLGEYSSVGRES